MVQITHIIFAHEAAETTGGIGALGLDAKAFVIQLITFLLAFYVLKRFAFEPIVKVMNQRRETIEAGVTLGEEMKKERAALDDKIAEELQKARKEADGIIANSQDAGRQVVADAEAKATQKAAGIMREAEARIETETTRARKALEGELVTLISDATEAIIGEKVDSKKDAQLIDAALKGSKA
jgi:F-type H+-transporting ATPase subunit b